MMLSATCAALATYATDTITFDLPARFLQQGTTGMTLTVIDEPSAHDDETNAGITGGVLALEQDPEGEYAEAEIRVDIEPTIFYVRQGSGLPELVDVYICHNSPLKGGELTLNLAG